MATQLSRADNLNQRHESLSQQVDMLKDAINVSTLLYQSARADYMEVLMTRRDSLEAQVDLTETQLQEMQTVVALYRALGGVWNY